MGKRGKNYEQAAQRWEEFDREPDDLLSHIPENREKINVCAMPQNASSASVTGR